MQLHQAQKMELSSRWCHWNVVSAQELSVYTSSRPAEVRGSVQLHMHWCLVPFVMLSDICLASRSVYQVLYFISPAWLPFKSKGISDDLGTLVPVPSQHSPQNQGWFSWSNTVVY